MRRDFPYVVLVYTDHDLSYSPLETANAVGQYCDLARQFDPRPSPNTTNGLPNGTVVPIWTGGDVITPTLEKWGKYDLLAHMNKYFKSRFYPGRSSPCLASHDPPA